MDAEYEEAARARRTTQNVRQALATPGCVACCLCGAATLADQLVSGMCVPCTASQIDLTEGIEKDLEVEMCKTCGLWFRNPQWVPLEPESAELLSLCVKRIRGLKKLKLVDASWIWTEPHSRRLKLRLTVSQARSSLARIVRLL